MDPFKYKIFEDFFAFIVGIVAIGCATGVITSWFKWRSPRKVASPEIVQRLNDITERLARLDNAIDAVAVEVERISEGQRFTSKLLAERASSPPLERPRSGNTPH
ncbi:MAG TPA: hypothetical protein VH277_08165 [Gemmatimonadaceae bacterium]|jgi:hypothetical protein|nr:hypothetical protein [Gemmatimonadaceae bacterium]